MICGRCGSHNDDSALFCASCRRYIPRDQRLEGDVADVAGTINERKQVSESDDFIAFSASLFSDSLPPSEPVAPEAAEDFRQRSVPQTVDFEEVVTEKPPAEEPAEFEPDTYEGSGTSSLVISTVIGLCVLIILGVYAMRSGNTSPLTNSGVVDKGLRSEGSAPGFGSIPDQQISEAPPPGDGSSGEQGQVSPEYESLQENRISRLDRRDMQLLIDRFTDAIEEKDAAVLNELFNEFPQNERKIWTEFFALMRDVNARSVIENMAVYQNHGIAQVFLHLGFKGTNGLGISYSWDVHFVKTSSGWRFQKIVNKD